MSETTDTTVEWSGERIARAAFEHCEAKHGESIVRGPCRACMAAEIDLNLSELRRERDEARAEFQRVTEVSDDDAWVFDVPGDDKACVAEYRIRWLRVKMLHSAALARESSLKEALADILPMVMYCEATKVCNDPSCVEGRARVGRAQALASSEPPSLTQEGK